MQDFEEKIIDITEGKSPEAKFGHPTIFHELVSVPAIWLFSRHEKKNFFAKLNFI